MSKKQPMDKSRWYLVSYDLHRIMSIEEACVFAHLQNVLALREKEGAVKPDGWFRCSNRVVQQTLALSDRSHWRIMGNLESKGYIKQEMRGNPARRHITLCLKVVEREAAKAAAAARQFDLSDD